ncbi:protease inhibitor I42 family protein, partial [Chloroflexota bacterium]
AYDGIEDTLKLVDTLTLRCPYCWSFIFEFDSRHAGYGDRTGQVTAQVITPHRAAITISRLEVVSAVMDEKWDMLKQTLIGGAYVIQDGALSVAQLLENPVYDTEVVIYGTVSLLGELFCPCFELTSGGESVMVWYGLMVENDGTESPAVSVDEISNVDTAIVTGELKGEGGTHYSKGDFWATKIAKAIRVAESADASYSGKEVEVTAGSSFTVTLDSNATTGFQWELVDITDDTVLELSDQTYATPQPTDPPMVGAGGKEVWTFKALSEGECTITMEYSQPWEGGTKAAETFTLTMFVLPAIT